MNTLYPVILAGGGGTRLWPLSREHYPKQFLSLSGEGSLLQQTLRRLEGLDGTISPPLIISNEAHRFLVLEQARQTGKAIQSIVLEPVGRNTAPALTCAALISHQDGHDPLLLMMPADHVIRDVAEFQRAIIAGMAFAQQGFLVTFGIVPDCPETGYGYIRQGPQLSGPDEKPRAHRIEAFVEKPDLATAEDYVISGNYAWNSGIFMMKSSVWVEAIGRYRPEILAACEKACGEGAADGDFYRLGQAAFSACPSDSADYAVMEKVAREDKFQAVVISLQAGWSDVGSWTSLWQISRQDAQGNVTQGDVCAINAKDNLLISEHRLVAALGCEDMVIVETPDAVMVASKGHAQDVKRIVEWLKENHREERLTHRRVYRPWGSYEGVDTGDRFQVKRIVVNPGHKLSLQMHHHRSEHWIIVKGTAKITRGDEELLLTENQSTYIPLGVKHRLENPGTIPLEIIEVQVGPYLGEDDIVRFEDVYKRT
jgi:mannose-1-phosphate guanylyltransferase/mannose-6-phosphate isomerase